jgi:hypothetical protein
VDTDLIRREGSCESGLDQAEALIRSAAPVRMMPVQRRL